MKFMLKSLIIVLSLGVFNLFGSDKDKKAKAAPKAESKASTGSSSSSSSSSTKSERSKSKERNKLELINAVKNGKMDSTAMTNLLRQWGKNKYAEIKDSLEFSLSSSSSSSSPERAIKQASETKAAPKTESKVTTSSSSSSPSSSSPKPKEKKESTSKAKKKKKKKKTGSSTQIHTKKLIDAINKGDFAKVKEALENGANPNAKDGHDTVFITACIAEEVDSEIVELLLEHGAEIDGKNQYGDTALIRTSCMLEYDHIIDLLLEHGADIHAQNDQVLMNACKIGNVYLVNLALEKKANVNTKDSDGNTPLMNVCRETNLDNSDEVVKLLLAKEADVNIRNIYGETALMSLIQDRDAADYESDIFRTVKLLIEAGLDFNAEDNDNNTALSLAEKSNLTEIVKLLKAKGAKNKKVSTGKDDTKTIISTSISPITTSLSSSSPSSSSPKPKEKKESTSSTQKNELINAIRDNQIKEAIELIKSNKINLEEKDIHGYTALMLAATSGQAEIVKSLIEHKVNVNAQNKFNETALQFAARNRNFEIVKLLVEGKADVNVQNTNGHTPLMYAFSMGEDEQSCKIVELLLEHKADANIKDKNGETVLIFALNKGCLKIPKLLITRGANVNIKDKNGDTPLILSLNWGNYYYEIQELLIKKGADVNIPNKDGDTPLILSFTKETDADIQGLLIKNSADVNVTDKDGNTPLMLSFNKGEFGTSDLLIEKGADINKPNKYGDTPLMFASNQEHAASEIEELLNRPGIKINAQTLEGRTALMIAASTEIEHSDALEVVELLLEKGADINIQDKDGRTALNFASDPEMRELLIKKGAKIASLGVGMPAPESKDEHNLFDKLKALEISADKLKIGDGSPEDLFLNYRRAFVEAKIPFDKISTSSKMYPASDLLIRSYEFFKNKYSQDQVMTLFKKLEDSLNKLKLEEFDRKAKKEIFDECNKILKEIRNTDKTQKIAATLKIKQKLAKIERALRKKVCTNCYSLFKKLRICSECWQIRYCSRECQVEDRKNHKPNCIKKIKDNESKEQKEEESKTEKDDSKSVKKDVDSESKEEKKSAPKIEETKEEKSESKREANLNGSNDVRSILYFLSKPTEITVSFVNDKIRAQVVALADLDKLNVLKWLHLRIEELDIENASKYSDEFDEKAIYVLTQLNSILKFANERSRNLIKNLTSTIKNNIEAYVDIYEYIYISLKNEKLKDKLLNPDDIKAVAHYYEKGLENMAIELSKSSTSDTSSPSTSLSSRSRTDTSSPSTSLSSRSEAESKESSYVFKPAKKCIACSKWGTKVCSGCRKVHYCSTDCQTKDWENHKLAHALFKNASSLPLRLTYKPDLQDPK